MIFIYYLSNGHTAATSCMLTVAEIRRQLSGWFMKNPTRSNQNLYNISFSIFEEQVTTQKESLGIDILLDQTAKHVMANTTERFVPFFLSPTGQIP